MNFQMRKKITTNNMKRYIISLFSVLFLSISLFAQEDILLEWDANVEDDLAGYNVYRIHVGSDPVTFDDYILLTETGIPCGPNDNTCVSYSDVQVQPGTVRWYSTAFDTSDNESDPSNVVELIIDDTTPPSPPANFRGQRVGNQVNLEWDSYGNSVLYAVFRISDVGKVEKITETTNTSFKDKNINKDTKYFYRLYVNVGEGLWKQVSQLYI